MAGGKLKDAPLCHCGAPCPKRPSQDLYRPRCDACEARLIAKRKRESLNRSKTKKALGTMARVQRP